VCVILAYAVPGVVEYLHVADFDVVRDKVVCVVPEDIVPDGDELYLSGGVVSPTSSAYGASNIHVPEQPPMYTLPVCGLILIPDCACSKWLYEMSFHVFPLSVERNIIGPIPFP
jgi:hypothetical protein